jgi:hypothetical protein
MCAQSKVLAMFCIMFKCDFTSLVYIKKIDSILSSFQDINAKVSPG